MNHEQAKSIIENFFTHKFFKIRELLNVSLCIPNEVLGDPFYVSVYINKFRVFEIYTDISGENFIFDTSNTGYATYIKSYGSAWYEPEFHTKRLLIDLDYLKNTDCFISGISEIALFEILVLHEFVHIAMMSNTIYLEDPIWITSEKVRYIHESIALRSCESIFSELYKYATMKDVNLYLEYVKKQSSKCADGDYYSPYFSKYRNLNNDALWQALINDSPLKLPFS